MHKRIVFVPKVQQMKRNIKIQQCNETNKIKNCLDEIREYFFNFIKDTEKPLICNFKPVSESEFIYI